MPLRHHPRLGPPPPGARLVGAVFGFAFFGIGLTVLIFLWAAPFGEFGSPPLFFRVFGSFIALTFLAVGGTVCVGSIAGSRALGPSMPDADEPGTYQDASTGEQQGPPPVADAGYRCPHCGAPLADGADISPHGDTKCTYCNCWFNIHGK